MSFERQHGDLYVTIFRRRRDGDITHLYLNQDEEQVQLTPAQVYALVDDVAVADPDEWARRFPPEDAAELALRRVADYCRTKGKEYLDLAGPAKDPLRARYLNLAEGLRQAMMQALQEIEALYRDTGPTRCNWCPGDGTPLAQYHPDGSVAHVVPRHPAQKAINDHHARRRA